MSLIARSFSLRAFNRVARIQFGSNPSNSFSIKSFQENQNDTNLEADFNDNIPEGVRQEVYELYQEIFSKTDPTLSKKQTPKLSLINKFLTSIQEPSELSLAPEIIERWRRRQLKVDGLVSRFPFYLAEELSNPDIAFQLLADRHRYGLHPRTREFNRVLRAYSKQAPESDDLAEVKPWAEKLLMTYGLMSYYNVKPDDETAAILLKSLFNSPLRDDWFPRLYKLAHEFKQDGVTLSDDISEILAELVTKHGRPSYGVPMPTSS